MAVGNIDGSDKQGEPSDIYEPDPRNVRLLKWAVIIMGILLVLGTVVVVVTIIYRASNLPQKPVGFADIEAVIPAGATVRSVELNGDRMAVHVEKDGLGQILIINVRKGRVDGRVVLKPQGQ